MALALPDGLGFGIPYWSYFRRQYPTDEHTEAYLNRVWELLDDPPWGYVWHARRYTRTPKKLFVMVTPTPPENRAMDALGWWPTDVKRNQQSWLVGNEMNGPQFGMLSEEAAIRFYLECGTAFDSCYDWDNFWSYTFITPNGNIAGRNPATGQSNFEWLKLYWQRVRHVRRARLAIHLWGAWEAGLQTHWDAFLNWLEPLNEKGFYITEMGKGGDTSQAEEVAWLEEAERRGVFSHDLFLGGAITACTHVWDEREWQGALDGDGNLTPYGECWLSLSRRLKEGRR